VPADPAARRPHQPERLRRESLHLRRKVEHYELIALQPRLEPDVPAHTRSEVATRETPLILVRRETPHRRHILEPGAPAHTQRAMALNEADLVHVQVTQFEPARLLGIGSRHRCNAGHSTP